MAIKPGKLQQPANSNLLSSSTNHSISKATGKIRKVVTMTAVAVSCALFVNGCVLKPKPYSLKDKQQMSKETVNAMYANQPPLEHSLTLPEAIARALKFNLAHRVEIMNVALASGELTLASWDMMPSLDAEVHYSHRNNTNKQLLVTSEGLLTESSSVIPRDITTAHVGIDWDLLDFGLSYIKAHQQGDRVLIAQEQRNKVMQSLVNQVIVAYWKAYSAQRMMGTMDKLRSQVKTAMQRSQQIGKGGSGDKAQQLDYQYLLVKSLRQLDTYKNQLLQAKQQLASLINLPPNSKLHLLGPSKVFRRIPKINISLQDLDSVALVYRPELVELKYQTRIARNGIKATLLEQLPGLHFNYGYNYNSNKFLVNNDWLNTDLASALNLIHLATLGKRMDVARTNLKLEQLRHAAMVMGVLTQIRLADLDYQMRVNDYKLAAKEADVANALYEHARREYGAKAGDEQTVIRRGLVALNSTLDEAISFAALQDSIGKMYQSIGLQLLPWEASSMDLESLSSLVREQMVHFYRHGFDKLVHDHLDKIEQSVATKPSRRELDAKVKESKMLYTG